MANTSAPRGFYNPRLRTGGEPNTHSYKVTAGQCPIVPGQVLAMTAAGTVSVASTANLSNIAGGGHWWGVSMSSLTTTATAGAGTGQQGYVEVVDDLANTIWDVQTSHAATSQALIGESLAGSSNNVVETTLNQSRGVLKAASAVGVGMCTVIDFVTDDLNDTDAANPRVTVFFRSSPVTAI